MVVALHLEGAEQPVTEIDGAGVLSGAERDAGAFRRQCAEQLLRMLVRAVLAPHRAEHRPLECVRLAPGELAHAGALKRSEADLGKDVQLRLRRFRPREHRGRAHAAESAPMKRSIWSAKASRSGTRVWTCEYTSSMSVSWGPYAGGLRRFARCSRR